MKKDAITTRIFMILLLYASSTFKNYSDHLIGNPYIYSDLVCFKFVIVHMMYLVLKFIRTWIPLHTKARYE